jgi:cell division protein FtsB
MSGLVLLIIGLASLGLVLAMLAYCGLTAWRVFSHALQVYGHVGPLADQLSDWSVVAESKAQHLADNGEQIAANIARLQVSVQRLQMIAEVLSESARPYRRVFNYLGVSFSPVPVPTTETVVIGHHQGRL